MVLVLTSCTNRKSATPEPALRAATLPSGPLRDVAGEWHARSRRADSRIAARRLYQGRGFREAEKAAAEAGARFAVISAGFGILEADSTLPAYALTVTGASDDNVLGRLPEGASGRAWWSEGLRACGAAAGLDPFAKREDLVLLAAGRTYLDMISSEVAELSADARSRLRIFTAARPTDLDPLLQPFVMPYDSRLDGPDSGASGTLSDFSQRALRHFVREVLPDARGADAPHHAASVRRCLAPWRRGARMRGASRTDADLVRLIVDSWSAAGGRSSNMLRLLRGPLGVACEQRRFKRLYAEASASRSCR